MHEHASEFWLLWGEMILAACRGVCETWLAEGERITTHGTEAKWTKSHNRTFALVVGVGFPAADGDVGGDALVGLQVGEQMDNTTQDGGPAFASSDQYGMRSTRLVRRAGVGGNYRLPPVLEQTTHRAIVCASTAYEFAGRHDCGAGKAGLIWGFFTTGKWYVVGIERKQLVVFADLERLAVCGAISPLKTAGAG